MNNTQQIGSSILKLSTALCLAVVTTASAQTFTLLHTFTGSDGSYPVGSLIVSNAMLYGMTSGRVFKMNTNVPREHRWEQLHQRALFRRRHE